MWILQLNHCMKTKTGTSFMSINVILLIFHLTKVGSLSRNEVADRNPGMMLLNNSHIATAFLTFHERLIIVIQNRLKIFSLWSKLRQSDWYFFVLQHMWRYHSLCYIMSSNFLKTVHVQLNYIEESVRWNEVACVKFCNILTSVKMGFVCFK